MKPLAEQWQHTTRHTAWTHQHQHPYQPPLCRRCLTRGTHAPTTRNNAQRHQRSRQNSRIGAAPCKTLMTNLTRRTDRASNNHINIDGMDIDILPHTGKLKYLGQTITFHTPMEADIDSRLRAPWSTFTFRRQELTSKHYPLANRLRLFDATVTPCVLYAAGTWTPNEPLRQIYSRHNGGCFASSSTYRADTTGWRLTRHTSQTHHIHRRNLTHPLQPPPTTSTATPARLQTARQTTTATVTMTMGCTTRALDRLPAAIDTQG